MRTADEDMITRYEVSDIYAAAGDGDHIDVALFQPTTSFRLEGDLLVRMIRCVPPKGKTLAGRVRIEINACTELGPGRVFVDLPCAALDSRFTLIRPIQVRSDDKARLWLEGAHDHTIVELWGVGRHNVAVYPAGGQCPTCYTNNPAGTLRERQPDGNTVCGVCGVKTPSREWRDLS